MKKKSRLLEAVGAVSNDNACDVTSFFKNVIDPARQQQPLIRRDESAWNIRELFRFDLCVFFEFGHLSHDLRNRFSNLVGTERARFSFTRNGPTRRNYQNAWQITLGLSAGTGSRRYLK